jgi:hypothetical protein
MKIELNKKEISLIRDVFMTAYFHIIAKKEYLSYRIDEEDHERIRDIINKLSLKNEKRTD